MLKLLALLTLLRSALAAFFNILTGGCSYKLHPPVKKGSFVTQKELLESFTLGWNELKPEHFNSPEQAFTFPVMRGKRKRVFGREVMQSPLKYYVVLNADRSIRDVVQEIKKDQYKRLTTKVEDRPKAAIKKEAPKAKPTPQVKKDPALGET